MRPVLFIDRDGTIICEPEDEQIDTIEKLAFADDVFFYLRKIREESDFVFVMVTNQDGLGTDAFPEEHFWPLHHLIMRTLQSQGIHFDAVYIDRHLPQDKHPDRKPGTGMLIEYLEGAYDLERSFVIGDRTTDVELAQNIGCKAIHIAPQANTDATLTARSWREIYEFLILKHRRAVVRRATRETNVAVSVNLDGNGTTNCSTGLGFFDHMLDQLGRHGGVDLEVRVEGDLEVDEHHTIEDTALALGEAFLRALGNKRGIQRYGFLLPMDDCLAQVAVDFGGRPWLVWEAAFIREKIGQMPTEMFMHFFKSFSDTAKCNLNIKAEGENEHHKIEAIFKAFARAVKMAVKRNPEGMQSLPSTKGTL